MKSLLMTLQKWSCVLLEVMEVEPVKKADKLLNFSLIWVMRNGKSYQALHSTINQKI